MRIGRVVGRVTLSRAYATLAGGRFVIIEVQDRYSLARAKRQTNETLVVYDHLGAGDGDLIAFSESREACMPFYPEKRVPIDAYNAAILDAATITHRIEGTADVRR
jgi:microcompartment protein CcmK/EutM